MRSEDKASISSRRASSRLSEVLGLTSCDMTDSGIAGTYSAGKVWNDELYDCLSRRSQRL